MKQELKNLWLKLISGYYYWNQGMLLMTFINFALLIITASDKLMEWFHLTNTGQVILIFIPVSIISVIAFGWILVTQLKFPDFLQNRRIKQDPPFLKVMQDISDIKQTLEEMKNGKG